MQNGPIKILVHEYWSQFHVNLWELFHRYYPNMKDDDLIPHIKKIFPKDKKEESKVFFNFIKSPPAQSEDLLESKKPTEAEEVFIDEIFIKNYIIGMRMTMYGLALKGLPIVSLVGVSQKSVAQALQQLPKLFSKSKLPLVKTEQTLVFAKLYYGHGQVLVEDRLDAGSVLANKALKTQIPLAKKQSVMMLAMISRYEQSLDAKAKVDKALFYALTNQCVWLQALEENLMLEILKLTRLIPMITEEDEPNEELPWYSSIGLPKFLTREYWSPIEITKDEVIQKEEVYETLSPIIQKSKMLDIMVSQLEVIVSNSKSNFEKQDGDGKKSKNDEMAMDYSKLSHHIKMVIRAIQEFYHTLNFMMQNIQSVEAFCIIYFKHIDATYADLKLRMVDQIKKQHHEFRKIFSRAFGLVPYPEVHKQAWYDHFEPFVKGRDEICYSFTDQKEGSSTETEKDDVSFVSQLFSKLKLNKKK